MNDGTQSVPNKPEASVVGSGWRIQDGQKWCWGRFVEIRDDDEVRDFEVGHHEEKDQGYCSIPATEWPGFPNGHISIAYSGGLPKGSIVKSSKNRSRVRQ